MDGLASHFTSGGIPWISLVIIIALLILVPSVYQASHQAKHPEAHITIKELWVYPIKGCKGTQVHQAEVDQLGLLGDRRWMIVDSDGVFQSQREISKMALIHPEIMIAGDGPSDGQAGTVSSSTVAVAGVRLTFPGMTPLEVPVLTPQAGAATRQVTIWGQAVAGAADQGDEAAAWLAQALGSDGLRLVWHNDEVQRELSDKQFTPRQKVRHELADHTAWADGYPMLVLSDTSLLDLNHRLVAQHGRTAELSMASFRPNVVVTGNMEAWDEDFWRLFMLGPVRAHGVKRCARCRVTTVNQETGEGGDPKAEPLATLRSFRRGVEKRHAVFVGLNACHEYVPGDVQRPNRIMRVGDPVRVKRRGVIGPK